ncbi:putative ATP-dependent RNA helicase DHX35 [Halotydeus destructor]|nr:putative ATP-dependent RNA helicase DHX35 [Halotydeus destructor]
MTSTQTTEYINEERKDDGDTVQQFSLSKSLSSSQQRHRLPIYQYRDQILFLLEKYQVVIIQGETGSGKSTQVAQYLADSGWCSGVDDEPLLAGVTQPRRVAAMTLAKRVAEERGCDVGDEVGYTIRFDDMSGPKTKIKFVTEGVLIREMMSDPLLNRYSVVMVDEAHERTINTDILIGLLKRILAKRPNFRLIVSSATLEAQILKDYFDSKGDKDRSTILSVEGRSHPIDVHYIREPIANYVTACVETVIKIHENERSGDVLVFLTGQDEVEEAVHMLKEYSKSLKEDKDVKKMFVLPMYSALPPKEQSKVFESFPRSVRKIVVSTNVAEASITISGIVYVVDCGFVKMRFYSHTTCSDSLMVVPTSQASAQQRAGRSGRIRSGKVFRLYPESEYDKLRKFTIPEIERSNLSFTILQLKALGIRNILSFEFPTKPSKQHMISGIELLYALGAIDESGELIQPLGMQMAEFPLHPMFAKMLLSSEQFECSEEGPNDSRHAAGKVRSWADRNYLNYNGLLRACEVRKRLESLLRRFNVKSITADGDVDSVRKCIVSGFFANAAFYHPTGVYKTVRGDHVLNIHPSSVLYTQPRPPKWVIYNDILHTSQEFMRDVTVIDPKWLYEIAPHYYQYGTDRELRDK